MIVVGRQSQAIQEFLPFAVGTIALLPPLGKLAYSMVHHSKINIMMIIMTCTDSCFIGLCLNCATCIDQTFRYRCPPAYSGEFCEVIVDLYALNSCQNDQANCTNLNSTDYVCDCGIEFTGRDCEIAIDHCALFNPNCNNGSCVDGYGTFVCQCDIGFSGETCAIELESMNVKQLDARMG